MSTDHSARLELGSGFESARQARSWVADEIRVMDLSPRRQDEVTLLASELVTNAVQHADSVPVITLRAERGRLVIGVSDSGGGTPATGEHDPRLPGGWGLQIVDRLADSWGVQHLDGGKVVWFSVDFGA